MGEVYDLDLDHSQQVVLLALADHADHLGYCWPSKALLAWKVGCSTSTIKRVLRCFRQAGILEAVAYEQGGRGQPTRYRIHLEKGVRKPPFVPRRKGVKSGLKGVKSGLKGVTAMPPEPLTNEPGRACARDGSQASGDEGGPSAEALAEARRIVKGALSRTAPVRSADPVAVAAVLGGSDDVVRE